MSSIYIAFGANLSNPKSTFTQAMTALEDRGAAILQMSGLWQSPAWPMGSGQPDYINACAEIDFEGSARELLDILHSVETEFGRIRSVKNAARALDLDLLDFKGEIITDKKGMIVPHPRMLSRGFVLLPLSEIAANWKDPRDEKPLWDWISKLPLCDVELLRSL